VSVHLFLYGGNLIDADVKRKTGGSGNDQFREFFPVVGYRTQTAETIEVLDDGSDGKEAVIRVTGKDASSRIVELLDSVAQPLGAILRTDYILKPDVPYLLIRTEVENPTEYPLNDLMVGDFIAMGGATHVFTTEEGFQGTPVNVAALLGAGRGAAYGYTVSSGTINLPVVDSNGTLAILGADFSVPPGQKRSFDRFFVVGYGEVGANGDRDLASVMTEIRTIRDETVLAVSGQVDSPDGGVAGALVTVFDEGMGSPDQGGRARNQALANAKGHYSMTLPAGKYDFVASAPGRLRTVAAGVEVAQTDVTKNFQLDPPGQLAVEIKEADGSGTELGLVPAKVSLACGPGAEAPWEELRENERHDLCATVFSKDGSGSFPVKPGHYKATVSRGTEYEIVTMDDLVVESGQTATLKAVLKRSLDTTGWMAGDFHQHTLGSIDSELTHEEKVVENLVEGVEIAAITDHDNMTSYGPAIAKLGVGARIFGLDGDEVSVNLVGHFNLFVPQGTKDALYPFIGAKLFADRTIPELFEAVRKIPGVQLIQMNHPRDGHGYLRFVRFDPISATSLTGDEDMAWDFDSMEVKDSVGTPDLFLPSSDANLASWATTGGEDIPVMRDWFTMLNLGKHTCAVGDSDAHNRNDGVGYSRNLLRMGRDSGPAAGDVVAAVQAQKNVVSNGPFVHVLHGGVEAMGHTEVVSLDGADLVLRVVVAAPTWIPVDSLTVYANGRPLRFYEVTGKLFEDETASETLPLSQAIPVAHATTGPVVRLDTDVHLFPKQDTWYVFLVQGPGSLAPVGDGTPFAYTNPVYVDVDGGGFKAVAQP
jgi:hypothetical protein